MILLSVLLKKIVREINSKLSDKYADYAINKEPYVIGFYLHKIFSKESERTFENGNIAEGMTITAFENFIVYFKKRNFNFIDENDLLDEKLLTSRKNIYLSFDDGYFNNMQILPLLNKYKVKATVYICSNHCEENKGFWWDILARERHRQNIMTDQEQKDEVSKFYTLKWQQQDQLLQDEFGKDIMYLKNDLMRPMNPKELKLFSENSYITIGNHTTNHQNLCLYTHHEIVDCVQTCNTFLEKLIDQKVSSIAYPYGFFPENIKEVMVLSGIQVGQTVEEGRDNLADLNIFKIKRNILSGYFNMEWQCKEHYHDFSFIERIKQHLS